jgi:tRNA-binding EMAP/Myf-like protein
MDPFLKLGCVINKIFNFEFTVNEYQLYVMDLKKNKIKQVKSGVLVDGLVDAL